MKKIFLYIGLIIISISQIYAQNFKVSVSANPVTEGERFQIYFILENAQGSNFTPPNFKGFTVLSGPFPSSNMQWVNGVMTSSISYSYILQAAEPGKHTIGPATITAGGKKLQTNPIDITILKPSAAQQQQKQQQQDSEKSLGKQANDIINKNLFVVLNVSKRDTYIGEQIIATYKLYVNPQLNVLKYDAPNSPPSLVGFWTQEIDFGRAEFKRETYNGVLYNAATIKKVILMPQKSGKLEIDPFILPCVVRLRVQGQQRRDDFFGQIFDDPFFSNNYKDFDFKARSNSVSINVRPLPDNAPKDFNGGVGDFSMEAWLDKKQTKTNEPVTLKIKISGKGNLKLIDNLVLKLPPDLDSYDPKITDNLTTSEAGISGSKTFEYLLIPRHAGEFKIDPVKFSYYDLQKRSYITISSKEFVINVEKGAASEATQVISGVNKEEVKFIGKDIRFIKTSDIDLNRSRDKFFGSSLFAGLSSAPLALFLLFIFLYRKNKKLQQNQLLLKNRRATKIARKRLAQANKLLTQGNKDKYYEELSHALWGYLSDKLSIPVSD
jgi:hypothetical protein